MSSVVKQETAARIFSAHREILAAKKLLSDLAEVEKQNERNGDQGMATLRDAFGRRRQLQLGIPSGEGSHRLFDVETTLAKSVIRAHIANQERELVLASESAAIEMQHAGGNERSVIAPHAAVPRLHWIEVDEDKWEAASFYHDDGSFFLYRVIRRNLKADRHMWYADHDSELAGSGPPGPWIDLESAKRHIDAWNTYECLSLQWTETLRGDKQTA